MKFLIPLAALFAVVTATTIPVEAREVSAPASDASLKDKRCWSSYTVYGCSTHNPVGTQLGSKDVYSEGPVSYGDWCPVWCGANFPTATWASLNPGNCACGTGDITTIAPYQVTIQACNAGCGPGASPRNPVSSCSNGSCGCGGWYFSTIYQLTPHC